MKPGRIWISISINEEQNIVKNSTEQKHQFETKQVHLSRKRKPRYVVIICAFKNMFL